MGGSQVDPGFGTPSVLCGCQHTPHRWTPAECAHQEGHGEASKYPPQVSPGQPPTRGGTAQDAAFR